MKSHTWERVISAPLTRLKGWEKGGQEEIPAEYSWVYVYQQLKCVLCKPPLLNKELFWQLGALYFNTITVKGLLSSYLLKLFSRGDYKSHLCQKKEYDGI